MKISSCTYSNIDEDDDPSIDITFKREIIHQDLPGKSGLCIGSF